MSLHIERLRVLALTCMAAESYMSRGLNPLGMPLNRLWQHLQSEDVTLANVCRKDTRGNILSQSHMRQPGNRQQTTLLKIALQPLDYQHKTPERYTKNQLEETYLNLRQSYSYFQLQIFANVVSMEM